jgi:peptide deformylase
MSILKVARMGHPVLRQPARPVEPGELKTPRLQQLIDDMIETMQEYQGIGLAAPQVHVGIRLFVAGIEGEEDPLPLITIVNPEILPIGTTTVEDWEGCLSIPEVRGKVSRSREITVRGLDRRGKRLEMRVTDYGARVIQHETDHLDGVLFLDRMKSFETLTFLDEYSRFWSEERVTPE